MKSTHTLAFAAAGLLLATPSLVTSAPNPPLCIDGICIEDKASELKDLNWVPLSPKEATKAQWKDALDFWGTVFPEVKPASLAQHRQNLVQRRIDKGVLDFLEKQPTTCRYEVFYGAIDTGKDGERVSVAMAPDLTYQWRVISITKRYYDLPSSDHRSAYLDAVKEQYPYYAEDDYWGDAEAPLNWNANPVGTSYDFKFSLRHLVSYGMSQDSADTEWAAAFDHFTEHRELLAEKGIDSTGSWDSDTYHELYRNAEACKPKVTL